MTGPGAGAGGESLASVKSRLHRARLALRERPPRHLHVEGRAGPAAT